MVLAFSGIVSSLLIIISLSYCIIRNSKFDPSKHTLCYFGSLSKTSIIYNTSLFFIGIFQTIFCIVLLDYYHLLTNFYLTFLLAVGSICTVLASLIPVGDKHKLHGYFGKGAYFTLIPWVILFHVMVIYQNKFEGVIGLLISVCLLLGVVGLYLRYKKSSYPQLFFYLLLLIWNVYHTLVIL